MYNTLLILSLIHIFIAAYYVAESIPTIQTLFNEGGKLVHDFDLHDFLFAFWSHKGGNPILTQMWFVRDLLLLVICAPIIYLLARYAKFVAIFCFGLIWFCLLYTSLWLLLLGGGVDSRFA